MLGYRWRRWHALSYHRALSQGIQFKGESHQSYSGSTRSVVSDAHPVSRIVFLSRNVGHNH